MTIYYTKTETDDIDNELSSLVVYTYTNYQVDLALATEYYNSSHIDYRFDFKADQFTTHTKHRSTLYDI